MRRPRVVLDTNVLVSALRSKQGASYKALLLLGGTRVEFCLSVALALEYEAVVMRADAGIRLSADQKSAVLDYLCAVCVHQRVHFLWRPCLKDPGDDMVLEAAVASASKFIITHNKRDFSGAERFGIKVRTPQEFLRFLGDLP